MTLVPLMSGLALSPSSTSPTNHPGQQPTQIMMSNTLPIFATGKTGFHAIQMANSQITKRTASRRLHRHSKGSTTPASRN